MNGGRTKDNKQMILYWPIQVTGSKCDLYRWSTHVNLSISKIVSVMSSLQMVLYRVKIVNNKAINQT